MIRVTRRQFYVFWGRHLDRGEFERSALSVLLTIWATLPKGRSNTTLHLKPQMVQGHNGLHMGMYLGCPANVLVVDLNKC